MPATKAKPAKSPTKAKPARKAKPAKKEPTEQELAAAAATARSEAISSAMLELAEVRTEARAKRGGTPAKWLIFDEWFKALLAMKPFDLDAAAKRFPEVKASTIKAWRNRWRNLKLPSNGRGKEKQIVAAIKKGAVA